MRDIVVKFMADYLVILIVIAGGILVLRSIKTNHYQAYVRLCMMGLTALVLAKVIGTFFQPENERPFQMMGAQPVASYLNNPGFPSDHTLFVVVIAIAVWVTTRNWKWALLFFALAACVAVGRVVALVHTPLDVIGGTVIAGIAGLMWYGRMLFGKAPSTRLHHSK